MSMWIVAPIVVLLVTVGTAGLALWAVESGRRGTGRPGLFADKEKAGSKLAAYGG